MTKKIELYRPKEEFNRKCSYKIFLDDKELANLAINDKVFVNISDVNNSKKKLKVRMYRFVGAECSLSNLPGNMRIITSANKKLNSNKVISSISLILSGIALLLLESQIAKIAGICILLSILLGLIVSLTVWRNKWIEINITQNNE